MGGGKQGGQQRRTTPSSPARRPLMAKCPQCGRPAKVSVVTVCFLEHRITKGGQRCPWSGKVALPYITQQDARRAQTDRGKLITARQKTLRRRRERAKANPTVPSPGRAWDTESSVRTVSGGLPS